MTVENSNQGALLDRIGTACSLDSYVVATAVLHDGTVAVALGNGCIALARNDAPSAFTLVAAHTGSCLCMTVDIDGLSVLCGGDDGRLLRVDAEGRIKELAVYPGKWVEPVAASPASGLRAVAAGRLVHLITSDGKVIACRDHPSTVAGIAFEPKGRRVAVCHYGGLSIWPAKGGRQQPKRLECAGSHLFVTWAPDGRYLVSAMQENTLHGWRLSDGTDMLMAGYPVKVKSMAWLPEGRFLATSGADAVVCWPFHGKDGPMGKQPLELGPIFGALVTAVAAHPEHQLVAAGYDDGTAILMPLDKSSAVLLKPPGDGEVTALTWSSDGRRLVLGTDQGFVAVLTLDDWRTSPKAAN